MKNKFSTKMCLAIALLSTIACDEDNPLNPLDVCADAVGWTEAVSTELNAYNQASQAYNEEPTSENCAAVKTSAKNYFDALGDALECVPSASRADIDSAIKEAKDEVDRESCD